MKAENVKLKSFVSVFSFKFVRRARITKSMTTKFHRILAIIFTGVLLFTITIFGQATAVTQNQPSPKKIVRLEVHSYSLSSKLMNREMPYRIILPTGYASTSERYPVIYLLHGLTGHFNNWTDKTKLAEYSTAYKFIIVTPEGGDGWYTDSATVPADKYESYIVEELIPEIDKKFRTLADRDHRAIAGLSMGGYGAIKFGLKYPEIFSLAGSFSGALSVTATLPTTRDAAYVKTVTAIFGPPDSDARKANDVFKIVSEITDEQKKKLPFLYIDCGLEDFLFKSNRDFIELLLEKKIPHEYRQRPGGHSWTYWDAQVQEFLELSARHFKKFGAQASRLQ